LEDHRVAGDRVAELAPLPDPAEQGRDRGHAELLEVQGRRARALAVVADQHQGGLVPDRGGYSVDLIARHAAAPAQAAELADALRAAAHVDHADVTAELGDELDPEHRSATAGSIEGLEPIAAGDVAGDHGRLRGDLRAAR